VNPEKDFNVPDGIIAHLKRECGGNVPDRHVIDVTCGQLERETCWANPHSGTYDNHPSCAAKNAADLRTDSPFISAYRIGDIPHTRNDWVCYDFKERMIVPAHYVTRTYGDCPRGWYMKPWLIEKSADGESWRKVARKEGNKQLSGGGFTCTFGVAGSGECRFIRLAHIVRNDCLCISAWEIFGTVLEQTIDSVDVALAFGPCAGGRRPSSTGRSPGHTWAPSPPTRRVRLAGTMGRPAPRTSAFCFRSVPAVSRGGCSNGPLTISREPAHAVRICDSNRWGPATAIDGRARQ
jgi:hypothetical protein